MNEISQGSLMRINIINNTLSIEECLGDNYKLFFVYHSKLPVMCQCNQFVITFCRYSLARPP